jgi:outer membrane receptor for ferrienterochelin and colicins
MLKIFLVYIVFVSSLFAAEISGRVRNSLNGSPVIGANVIVENTSFGAASNYQGKFVIHNVPAGKYILDVQFVGFVLDSKPEIQIETDENIVLNLDLTEDLLETENIVVTGTRTRRLIKDSPVSTEVIHADEIKNIGAENVGEVLEERAGIIVNQDGARGGLLSAQLQGLDDNHTLILIDGMPMVGRIAGQLDLSRVSVQNIERIEIVKGAASALYGSEAVGGVVNIITRAAEKTLDYSLNANVGTFNARNIKADVSTVQNRSAITASAEHHQADGYDLDPRTQNTTADDFSNYSLFGKIRQTVKENMYIQASGEFFDQRQEGFDGGQRTTDIQNWYMNLGSEWMLENFSKFNARLYHTSYSKYINRAGTIIDNVEKLSRGEFIYNRVLYNHILTLGGEITDNRLNTNRIEDGKKSVQNYSLYAQDEILYKTLEFNLGARADYHSEFDFNISPKFGVLYKPTDELRFRGSFARGFRAPDFVELYLVLDHSGLTSQPYIAYGNPNLKPETSTSINAGAEYHFSSNAVMRVNFFNNHLTDKINSRLDSVSSDGVQMYTYENLNEALTRGMEWDMTYRFLTYYRLTGGYSFLETEDVATGKPFYNRPKHSARVKFDWDFETIGLSGNLRWRYIGERLTVNIKGQEIFAPYYALWHTRVKQKVWGSLSAYINVNNILDYQNRNYVALPGRVIFLGLEVN